MFKYVLVIVLLVALIEAKKKHPKSSSSEDRPCLGERGCPRGWSFVQETGSCYKVVVNMNAFDLCISMNSELVASHDDVALCKMSIETATGFPIQPTITF
ncbi:unnamed protein product, partial [Mesorhabditis belari]|uniref:Uncharacterized protein n=1 Tax=Mesorhabditis belari TaxID=2138241 RepID=A0AAF3FJX0_9BILA